MTRHRRSRWAAALASISLLAGPALAKPQPLAAPVLESVEATPPLHPGLWLVRDADTTIYLFGTIHMLKPGLNWLNGPVAGALNGSDTLVTEIVMDEAAELSLKQGMIKLALLPKGQTLRQLLPPEQRAAYEALLAREGMPAAIFDGYKPWYPALVLSLLPLMKLGMVPNAGVEERLEQAAAGKPRDGLETVQFQLALFDSLSREAQLAYLAAVVRDYDRIGPESEKMVDAWGKGDAEAIAAAMNAEMDSPEVSAALLGNRNKAWARWIEKRLEQPGTVFIAVGAGHLAGPESVQRQLAAEGIAAERVQ